MSYETKKRSSKDRGIPFLLTKKEYSILMEIAQDRKSRCAYTNMPFIHKQNHCQSPSLERLDDRLWYSFDNCVIVTQEANQLKDKHVDKGFPIEEGKDLSGRGAVVVKLCSQPEWKELVWDKQVGEYLRKKGLEHMINKETQTEEVKESLIGSIWTTKHIDVGFASGYVRLGALISKFVDFELSFAEYKQLMQRKTCQLTGRMFLESESKSLFILDKTKPANKHNCYATTKTLQEALDTFLVSANMDPKALKQLCKTIIK